MSRTIHQVVLDQDGEQERYTCHTEGCDKASVTRQPGMSDDDWNSIVDEFVTKLHYCRKVRKPELQT